MKKGSARRRDGRGGATTYRRGDHLSAPQSPTNAAATICERRSDLTLSQPPAAAATYHLPLTAWPGRG